MLLESLNLKFFIIDQDKSNLHIEPLTRSPPMFESLDSLILRIWYLDFIFEDLFSSF